MRRPPSRCATLVLFVAAACSSTPEDTNGDGIADGVATPNNVGVIAPVRPRGSVGGDVLDATTGLPLAGVKVVLFGGGLAGETTTDAGGTFQLGPVSAGARFSLRFSANNFADALVPNLVIDDTAGNFPVDNGALYVGPIELMPTTGRFSVQVVTDIGVPVRSLPVTIETAVRWFEGGTARGNQWLTATTDPDGRASFTGLVDLWALPPRLASSATMVASVPPIDLDGDMIPDLRGQIASFTSDDVRQDVRPPVIVMKRPGDVEALAIVASTLPRLVPGANPMSPALIGPMDSIRVVFNQPVDREGVLVELLDETGARTIPTSFVVGALGNGIEITHADPLEAGQKYNLVLRVQTSMGVAQQVLNAASPFFVKSTPDQPIRVERASFVDADANGKWGDDSDRLVLQLSLPLGRAGLSPAFTARLYAALDLDGNGVVGNATGELPQAGAPLPPPIMVMAAEPMPRSNVPLSGFTRVLASVPLNGLMMPIENDRQTVNIELQINPADNGGAFITDPSGRAAPSKLTATARLER